MTNILEPLAKILTCWAVVMAQLALSHDMAGMAIKKAVLDDDWFLKDKMILRFRKKNNKVLLLVRLGRAF